MSRIVLLSHAYLLLFCRPLLRHPALIVGAGFATHNDRPVLQSTDPPYMQLEGIYTPLITPFRPDLSPDYDAYGAALDWQIDNGVHGLIAGGSTGEFYALTTGERIEQLQFAARRIDGRIPLIAGVNDLLATRSEYLAAAARDAGASALLVAAPPYSTNNIN